MIKFREEHPGADITVGGDVGPRGDGYKADTIMTVLEAAEFHS